MVSYLRSTIWWSRSGKSKNQSFISRRTTSRTYWRWIKRPGGYSSTQLRISKIKRARMSFWLSLMLASPMSSEILLALLKHSLLKSKICTAWYKTISDVQTLPKRSSFGIFKTVWTSFLRASSSKNRPPTTWAAPFRSSWTTLRSQQSSFAKTLGLLMFEILLIKSWKCNKKRQTN